MNINELKARYAADLQKISREFSNFSLDEKLDISLAKYEKALEEVE